MLVKLMIVPGKIINVEVSTGATVMDVALKAADSDASVDWVGLARDREVRVNKKKYSNVGEVDETQGYAGSIVTTPLNGGDVVLVITKIQGNEAGALTCMINDDQYALETPDTIANVLRDVVGKDPAKVTGVAVDGDEANLQDLVGDGDYIEVEFSDDEPDEEEPVIMIDGVAYAVSDIGKLAAIEAILSL